MFEFLVTRRRSEGALVARVSLWEEDLEEVGV